MSTATLAPRPVRPLPSRGEPVRLTPRGKAVLVLALAVLALLAFSWSRQGVVQASPTSDGPATAYLTVEPGDTLWGIALRVAPHDDPRDTVDRILDLNQLSAAQLQAGERIVVPAS